MATTFFNLFTRPYNDVGASNFVKVCLYKTTDDLAIFTSQTSAAPGPLDATTWSFPGLPTVNFVCRIFEVTADDDVIRQIEGDFTFIPSSQTFNYKEPILIKIGTTEIPGLEPAVFPANVTNVTVPDWIGWEPIIELIGAGTQKENIDYTYNVLTGNWALTSGNTFINDVFFWVQFKPIIVADQSTSQYTQPFIEKLVITTDTTLTAADIGKKILIRPESSYIEVTLPDIATVTEFRIAYFEFCPGTWKCCKILAHTGDVIDWLKKGDSDRNAVYGCPNETIEIFKEVIDVETSVWRVQNSDGNFKTVGQRVSEDQISTGVFNKVPLFGTDSTGIDSDDYARLYYDYVVFLPSAQVCTYANWNTGENKYLYSLKDPSTGKFHVPDLRDLFERVTDGTNNSGYHEEDSIEEHDHATHGQGTISGSGGPYYLSRSGGTRYSGGGTDIFGGGTTVDTTMKTGKTGTTETQPRHVVVNRYVLV